MRKIKLGGEPWQSGTLPQKEPKKIKFKVQAWDDVPTEDKNPVLSNRIETKASEWGEIPADELKKEVAKAKEPVKFEAGAWDALSGLQEPNVIRQFEGVNELNSFAIKDSHATRNKNVTTSSFPALAARKSGTLISNPTAVEIDGIGVYATATTKELHVVAGGVWRVYKNSAWTTLRSGLSTTKKWSFVVFKGSFATNNLLVTNGADTPFKYDGTTVSALAGAQATGDFITTHDNRVYLATASTVYFSSLRKAEDWTTVDDAGQIVVETSDGKDITGLIAGSSRLTVFKDNSIHELFGNSPSNYTMKIVTDNLGSPTGQSAQVIDGVIYFLGSDVGVYRYSGGSLPSSDFSMQIRETINKINRAAANQSVSWSVGKKYYLAVPTGANTNPDTVLEYDIEFSTWNTWKFPHDVTASGAVLDGITYIGFANGGLLKLDNTGTTDYGTAIAWEWVSKPFTFASMGAKTRWYRLWVVADIPAGATLNVHLSNKEDGEAWSQVQSVTSNVDAQAKEILIPVQFLANSSWMRMRLEGTGQVVVYEVSRQERIFPLGLS